MMNRLIIGVSVMALFVGCAGGGNKKAEVLSNGFSLPEIPSVMTDRAQQMNYLAEHFWDNYDFDNRKLVDSTEYTEPILAQYLDVLMRVGPDAASKSVSVMLDRAYAVDSDVFYHFYESMEKYLYDPNSPLRDEELYCHVLEYIISSPDFDEAEKIRPEHQLAMIGKNRVGDIAQDFVYTLADGRTAEFFDIKADYVLLYINNPDCNDCARVSEIMRNSKTMNGMISNGTLKVLALYPDEDLSLWKKHPYPGNWINAYDDGQVLSEKKLYDLKAIPTLYLMDKDKRVIYKDAPVEMIDSYLYCL